ncbi:MAG: hypothetical protein AAGF59_00455 [Pseudomonadota bacterium]
MVSERLGPDQTLRLRAATLIKSIADSGDTFDNALADELVRLLEPMPLRKSGFKVALFKSGSSVEGEAAGVGNTTLKEEDVHKSWSVGERSFRCGAYVVEKQDHDDFEIRHVGEVQADMNPGEQLRLAREGGAWTAYLNEPKMISFLFVHIIYGRTWVVWKQGT